MSTAVTLRLVAAAVEAAYDLKAGALAAPFRAYLLPRPRFVAAHLCSSMTDRSSGQIGRALGGWRSSGVRNAVRAIEARRAVDAELAAELETIAATITAAAARGVVASGLAVDHDVLEVAAAIGDRAVGHTEVAADDIVAMAGCLVGQAEALKAVDAGLGELLDAVATLIAARDAGDAPAFEVAWDRLVALSETFSKDV